MVTLMAPTPFGWEVPNSTGSARGDTVALRAVVSTMAARHAKPWRLVDGVRVPRRTAPGYAERIVAEVAQAAAGGPQALAAAERRVAGYLGVAAGFGPRGGEPDPACAAGALAAGGSVEPERVASLFGALVGHDLAAHADCPACDAARGADWARRAAAVRGVAAARAGPRRGVPGLRAGVRGRPPQRARPRRGRRAGSPAPGAPRGDRGRAVLTGGRPSASSRP
jgi:hypothetical protein